MRDRLLDLLTHGAIWAAGATERLGVWLFCAGWLVSACLLARHLGMTLAPLALALARWEVWLVLSLLLTIVHAAEEEFGAGGPLWAYLSRVSGVRIDPGDGDIVVLLVVPAYGAALAILAWWTHSPFWLGAIAGARLADALLTHITPALLGARPNPGVWSALGYVAEAAFLLAFVSTDYRGVLVGAAPFLLLWPLLWLASSFQPQR